jgi:hypothetical protein
VKPIVLVYDQNQEWIDGEAMKSKMPKKKMPMKKMPTDKEMSKMKEKMMTKNNGMTHDKRQHHGR